MRRKLAHGPGLIQNIAYDSFLCELACRNLQNLFSSAVPAASVTTACAACFLAGSELIATEFEKQHAHHKAGALVAIHGRRHWVARA